MRPSSIVLIIAAALLVAGCGRGAAAPQEAPPDPGTAAQAHEPAAPATLPDVVGNDLEEARQALVAVATAGVRVLAFDPDGAVSAQQPPAGAAIGDDEPVVLWLGDPPAPPPAPPSEQTAEAARPDSDDVEDAEPGPASATDPAPAPTPTPEPTTTPAPAPAERDDAAGQEDPTEGEDAARGTGADTPARTSPRVLPASPAGLTLEGTASWYGPGFEGLTTACGDRFDPGALTLATRELRCGTRVALTGPEGATVEAVATDWGPAEWTGRRFDLSRATFEALAPLSRGTVEVTLRVLD